MACTSTSASACAAVGGSSAGTLAEGWNGTSWSIQPTPNPAGVQGVRLEGVACTSPAACTAVGGSFANASLAEQWNGTKWVIQAPPNPARPIFDLDSHRLGLGVLAGAASRHERLQSGGVLRGQVRDQARPINKASLDRIPSRVPRNVKWGGTQNTWRTCVADLPADHT